jgi:hypothetical protein
MTRSSGGSRPPNRPYRDDESRGDASDELDYEENGKNNGASRSRPARRSSASASTGRSSSETESTSETIDAKRRGIALMADVILYFALGMMFSPALAIINMFIPAQFITHELITILFLLVRDYPYQGRGIGKNLMGLQVLDYTTNLPPSLMQSFKRNVLFFVPWFLMGVLGLLKYTPLDKTFLNVILQIVHFACGAYVIVLLPAECWFALRGEGGRRIGDKFANTHIVQSNMDFSKFS